MDTMNRALLAALAAIIDTGNIMDPAATWIALLTNVAAPITPDSDLVDEVSPGVPVFTEANFSGYARIPVTAWTAPYESSTGAIRVEGDRADFQPTDALTPNTIIGAMLCNADGSVPPVAGELLAVELFDSPVSLLSDLDLLSVTPFLDEAIGGGFGVAS